MLRLAIDKKCLRNVKAGKAAKFGKLVTKFGPQKSTVNFIMWHGPKRRQNLLFHY